MVRAYHVIIGMYGFWLPNDPRGSWSEFVGSWELLRFGKATTVNVRQSVASAQCDHFLRERAKHKLLYPPVKLTGTQARAVVCGFGNYLRRNQIQLWACAIMPQHLHLVIVRCDKRVELVVNHLKGSATRRLNEEGVHPLLNYARPNGRLPKMFARGCWKVFLNTTTDIERAIRYVEENPLREGKRSQKWRCVTPYEGR